MFNQYLTVTYQYLINAYIIKAIFNQSWPIFKNNSYRLVILRQAMAWKGLVWKFTIHWVVLKFWAQTRKPQDKQGSKIAYSVNRSWYFNKTNTLCYFEEEITCSIRLPHMRHVIARACPCTCLRHWRHAKKACLGWLKKLQSVWQITHLKQQHSLSFTFGKLQRSYEKIMCISLVQWWKLYYQKQSLEVFHIKRCS